MVEVLRKTPVPMILPTTIDAASTSESPRTNSFDMGLSLLSVLINISKNAPQCK
jgi:hypothetical protein